MKTSVTGLTVWVTRGSKYHASRSCPLMRVGMELWDSDEWTAGSYLRTAPSPEYAAACGKLPCLQCVPAGRIAFTPLYGQDFGHTPVEVYGEQCCARCRDRGMDEHGDPWIHPTIWPCTSVVVLGLVAREVAA